MNLEDDELQAETPTIDENQPADVTVNPTDSAPAETEETPATPETGEGGEEAAPAINPGAQEAINRQTAKMHEQRRRAEEAERKITELQSQIPEVKRPEVPDAPDPFSENYVQEVADRDVKVQEQARFDAVAKFQNDQTQDREQAAQQKQNDALNKSAVAYGERAKASGVSQVDLQAGAEALMTQLPDVAVLAHIMQDEKGPAITQYLGKNPDAMDKMAGMSSLQAAVHIENVIKPKLSSQKQISKAPPPPTDLGNGGGSPPSQRGPAKATYD